MTDASMNEFRERVESFFRSNAKPAQERSTEWGVGSDSLVAKAMSEDIEDVQAARKYQAALFDAGLAWMTGPREYGGAGFGPEHIAAFREIASRYDATDTFSLMIGQQIVAPAILAFGTEPQKAQWLPALHRGDVIGCQLFSEPEAGSDLGSLKTRARRDGDGWLINGQKLWSSGAHLADIGELLARTEEDPELRSKGLSMFIVDMRSPGITVRPLRQMNGSSHFNEVFFENVFVPEDNLLGPQGGGWAVANASLSSERDLVVEDVGLFNRPAERLLELAAREGSTHDPVLRQRLARTYSDHFIDRILPGYLQTNASNAGHVAASITKLRAAQTLWDLTQTATSILGPSAVADDGQWGHFCWAELTLWLHSQRIAGGSDEIQRNIIAERGLGLPRDIRP